MEKILEKLVWQIYRNRPHSGIVELLFKYFRIGTVNEVLIKYYWKVQSKRWHFYRPPIRPSAGDLTIYNFFLGTKESAQNILILGATPELRNVLITKFPYRRIIIADSSPEMYDVTTKELEIIKPDSEKWIDSNWLFLPTPEQGFDIIIGDRVLEQFFSYKDEQRFFDKIKNLLRPEGVFISRFRLRNSGLTGIPGSRIISAALKENQRSSGRIPLALGWRLRDAYTNESNRTIDCASIKQTFEKYIQKHGPVPKIITAFELIKKDMDNFPFRWVYGSPSEAEFETLYSPFFTMVQERCSTDYLDARQYPIFIFKPRKIS